MTASSENNPSAPTGLYVDNITSTSYDLHWETPKDYVHGTQFFIYKNKVKPIPLPKNASPEFKFFNAQSATTFTIYVTQINSEGVESSPSNKISFQTLA